MNAHHYKYPRPPAYDSNKMDFKTPYEHTGMDYTGHVYVKAGENYVKMYLLVFTCLNIRSIHVEVLPDLTCRSFLLAFTRFSNRSEFRM